MELKNKTAIVTGSGSGIGRALALEFAKQGARVVCCGRRVERCAEAVEQIEKAGGVGLNFEEIAPRLAAPDAGDTFLLWMAR
jgi:3-oxoacyl-[acyl-carrier protein] reductase